MANYIDMTPMELQSIMFTLTGIRRNVQNMEFILSKVLERATEGDPNWLTTHAENTVTMNRFDPDYDGDAEPEDWEDEGDEDTAAIDRLVEQGLVRRESSGRKIPVKVAGEDTEEYVAHLPSEVVEAYDVATQMGEPVQVYTDSATDRVWRVVTSGTVHSEIQRRRLGNQIS